MDKTDKTIWTIIAIAITASTIFLGLVLAKKLPTISLSSAKAALIRCYNTNGVRVCHNQDDESVFYNTPANEVAYNVHTVREGTRYFTVYHSEAKNKTLPAAGDSIKTGIHNGTYNYVMPANKAFKIWGTQRESERNIASILYSENSSNQYTNVSGGGNPMIIAGRHWAGDPHYYAFFLGVIDDNANRTTGENDYRHYLLKAIALAPDYTNFHIWTQDADGTKKWYPFNDTSCNNSTWYLCRARTMEDASGQTIMSQKTAHPHQTQGLIGSIVIWNNVYYYFYTDNDPANPGRSDLYYRTNLDINQPWSAPIKITNLNPTLVNQPLVLQHTLAPGAIVRVAKAKGMDRWAVLYTCVDDNGQQDLCLEYTANMNIVGPGGISSLRLRHAKLFGEAATVTQPALGIRGSNAPDRLPGQPFWMTDKNGHLVSPDPEDSQGISRGGEIRWTQFSTLDGGQPFGRKVWRAGWTISTP